ncbi:leucine-rich repeats and immunoglobulin-like domains protein 2 [Cylas formicarius]|uniref:leucine-rich repeats and immunoglobulin-like domains protein 2 n=1 Tax=Cylas formicarius TaxID=197179 RepID=UPI002958B177|nr:leucine-rich repeats and immunoglobulin-like domains protein 2 [Cylas formicarius]
MDLRLIIFGLLASNGICNSFGWERDIACPLICTCQLQHLTETAIYRFMQRDKSKHAPGDGGSVENNEVVYDDTFDTVELLDEPHRAMIVRSATCILQTETNPAELIESLPDNIESLTFIHGYESGNKTIKFSWLSKFNRLTSLELVGPTIFAKNVTNHLLCQIDYSLPELNYLNLEKVLIHNSKEQIQSFLEILKESENITFEYIQKIDGSMHPVTIVQKNNNDDEVVPYEVFKEQRRNNGEVPLLVGFKKLLLLRIVNCELNNIHWEMFDGLGELQYLILERNNLRYIPPFAFYGTPHLKVLSLAHNKLLDIEITDLAGLLELEYLDLSHNNFTQLSELSLPPFPKLKLADFANNPINIIFPNTFEVMNTTNSLVIGSDDMAVTFLTHSFVGLNLLQTLTVHNVNVDLLKRDFFVGMSRLNQLSLSGNIREIEFDAFLEVPNLEKLILSYCSTYNISMDSFIGLNKLHYLDLSHNNLEYLPSGVFDDLDSIKEIYLNHNKFKQLPREIFSKIHPKLLRLNENPWHCTCEMSEWKPIIVMRVKQKSLKPCDFAHDKGISCTADNRYEYKYVFDSKIAPKCVEPEQFATWSVFQAMRRILKCPDYKPKLIKKVSPTKNGTDYSATDKISVVSNSSTASPLTVKQRKLKLRRKLKKSKYLKYKLKKRPVSEERIKFEDVEHQNSQQDLSNDLNNDLNSYNLNNNYYDNSLQIASNEFNVIPKMKQYKNFQK